MVRMVLLLVDFATMASFLVRILRRDFILRGGYCTQDLNAASKYGIRCPSFTVEKLEWIGVDCWTFTMIAARPILGETTLEKVYKKR